MKILEQVWVEDGRPWKMTGPREGGGGGLSGNWIMGLREVLVGTWDARKTVRRMREQVLTLWIYDVGTISRRR